VRPVALDPLWRTAGAAALHALKAQQDFRNAVLRESQVLLCQELGKSVEIRLQTDIQVGYIQSPVLYTNLYIHGKTVVIVTPESRKSSLFDEILDIHPRVP